MAEPVVVLAARVAVEPAGPARALVDLPVLATLRVAVLAPAPVLLAAPRVSRTRSWCACRSRILRTRPRSHAPVTLEAVAEPAVLARAARHVRAGPVVALAAPVELAGLARALVDPAEVLVDRIRSNILS